MCPAAAAASDAKYLLDAAAALAAAAAYRAMYNPIITIVTVLGLVGGAPAQGWGGDTARRRFIGGIPRG